MVQIARVEWHPYRIPFRTTFTTSHGTLPTRSGAIVEITTRTGIVGRGEIAPLPTFGGGDLASALAALHESALRERLHGLELPNALAEIYEIISQLPPSVSSGLELALLDALGQSRQLSVATLLQASNPVMRERKDTLPPRSRVAVNAVIGAPETAEAVRAARQAARDGFCCVKLKVGSETAQVIERVEAVRAALGPAIDLRLDANEGWTTEQAETILNNCAQWHIQYVEQPLPAHDLIGMRQLRQRVTVPIAADEAVYNLASAQHVLDMQAADILIIKPQLAGGLRTSQQIMQAASERSVRCVITSVIESGIGVAGALHLAAASPEIQLACGLATLSLLEHDLLQYPLLIADGHLVVPPGAGLGVQLHRPALNAYASEGEYA